MRYTLVLDGEKTDTGFSSLEKAKAYFKELELTNLDGRAGFWLRTRDGHLYELVHTKTGEAVKYI